MQSITGWPNFDGPSLDDTSQQKKGYFHRVHYYIILVSKFMQTAKANEQDFRGEVGGGLFLGKLLSNFKQRFKQ